MIELGLWGSEAPQQYYSELINDITSPEQYYYFQTSKAFIITTDYSDPEIHVRCLHDSVGHVPVGIRVKIGKVNIW